MIEHEVSISPLLLEKVLSSITPEAVLVGGQALSIWVSHYEVDLTSSPLIGSISDDADFLGSRDDVTAIAQCVSASPIFPPQRAMTALVGQVKIRVTPTEFVNVDVIHKVIGIASEMVKKHAFEATLGNTRFFVMHPLDVLQSRVENLAKLKPKQNTQGIEQTRLAVLVTREYIAEIAEKQESPRLALKAIEHVVSVAKSSSGKKVTQEFGISFFTAIPKYAIENQSFHTIRWPRICDELDTAAGNKKSEKNSLPISPGLDIFLKDGYLQVGEIKTDAMHCHGSILWADGQQAVQSLGRNQVVIYNISDWPIKPEVCKELRTIDYKNGTPTLKPLDHDREPSSLGR